MVRASELEGKEVINIHTGNRLGVIRRSELLINSETGTLEGLIIVKIGMGGREKEIMTIPWRKIKKISDELIIVESDSGKNLAGASRREIDSGK